MKYIIIFAFLIASGCIAWRFFAHKEFYSGDFRRLKPTLAIFDFDGTFCPSFSLFIQHLNALSDEYNFKKIEPEEVDPFRNLDAKAIVKAIEVSRFKLPFVIRKIRKNAQRELLELDIVPQMADLFRELKSKGVSLGILTSNSEENVRLYLQKNGIDFFDFIYSGNNLFGKGVHLKTILKRASLDPKQRSVFYIGDEARDVEAAKESGIIAVAVSWGYNSLALLKQTQPDYLCENPDQLRDLLFSLKP